DATIFILKEGKFNCSRYPGGTKGRKRPRSLAVSTSPALKFGPDGWVSSQFSTSARLISCAWPFVTDQDRVRVATKRIASHQSISEESFVGPTSFSCILDSGNNIISAISAILVQVLLGSDIVSSRSYVLQHPNVDIRRPR